LKNEMKVSSGHFLTAGLDGGHTIMYQIPPACFTNSRVLFLFLTEDENGI
jgi:hypothetical protein